ncbi:Ig-like domain-containing protein, partial [Neorhizobium sp. T786]|uniref:Ig-like domain-containing protein n=1 Tax=Pseudorhizobium xiangyangii TaxID=2883104 RepID=UPI001CFFE817
TIDTTAPDAPRFTGGFDAVANIVGEFADGAVINDGRPKLSGIGAEANAKVVIFQDGIQVATVTADAGGQWSWKLPAASAALADGSYAFTAAVVDAAGNQGLQSAPFSVTIDTLNPLAPTIMRAEDDQAAVIGTISAGGFTNDTTPRLEGDGALANGVVRIFDNGIQIAEVIADATGAWSYTPVSALGQGLHGFTVVSVDQAGNTSPASPVYSLTIDTAAPGAPVIGSVSDNAGTIQGIVGHGASTDDTTPTLSGSGAEGGSTVTIYDNGVAIGTTLASANGTWTFTPSEALSEAVHAFTVSSTDAAGNEGAQSVPYSVTVDLTGPSASFVPVIDNASDDVVPDTGLVGHNGFTNDTTPRLNGSGAEPNGLVRIYEGSTLLGQAQADASGKWSFTVAVLGEGAHSFTAVTVDNAGNEGASSALFTLSVDTSAPNAPVITGASDDAAPVVGVIANGALTNDATPTLTGTAEIGAIVKIYDGSTYLGQTTADGSGAWTFTPDTNLGEGTHNLRASAVDAAGNEGPQSNLWTVRVDTAAPNAPSISNLIDDQGSVTGSIANGGATDDTRPQLIGSGAEAGAIVTIYDNEVAIGTTIAASNGTWTFTPATPLSGSDHAFSVTATDAAGNEGPQSPSYSVTLDTSAPQVPKIDKVWDDSAPGIGLVGAGATTNDTTPTLSGTAEAG